MKNMILANTAILALTASLGVSAPQALPGQDLDVGTHGSQLSSFARELESTSSTISLDGLRVDFDSGVRGASRGPSGGGDATPAGGDFTPMHFASGPISGFGGSAVFHGSYDASDDGLGIFPRRAAVIAPLPVPALAGLIGLGGVAVIRRRSMR